MQKGELTRQKQKPSSQVPQPQMLTRSGWVIRWCRWNESFSLPVPQLPSSSRTLAPNVRVFHQRLTYQDGLGTALRQALDIRAGVDAAFGDQQRRRMACGVLRVAWGRTQAAPRAARLWPGPP